MIEFLSSGGALDPPEGFIGESVESGHGHGEMFFFRVLDFVVADALERLDEHHDGRDAGAGDFGGVVEGAGGEAMRDGAGFGNRFIAEGNEIVVEEDPTRPQRHASRRADLNIPMVSSNSTA